jgi:hypothetical protein
VVNTTPQPLYPPPGIETWCPLYRRLDGPHGESEWVRKILPASEFDPQTVQPLAYVYINFAWNLDRSVNIMMTEELEYSFQQGKHDFFFSIVSRPKEYKS